MIRMLLYRLLPIGAAAGIFGGALSPLRATLQTFGAAANALAGQQSVRGGDFEAAETMKDDLQAKLSGLSSQKPRASPSKRSLQQLAAQLRANPTDEADPFGEQPGARAPKPIARPGRER